MWHGAAVALVFWFCPSRKVLSACRVAGDGIVRWFRCIEGSSLLLRPSPPNGGPIRL